MTRWSCACLLIALSGVSPARAETPTGFLERVYRDAAGEHRYVVFVPPTYTPDRPVSVILYLHGAGGRGNDGARHLRDGLAPVIGLRGNDFPAIVVFPQCEDTEGPILKCWLAGSPDGSRALRILAEVEQAFSIDPRRRVLAGWSMGGYGAWSLAAATPDRWAAVVPISGGGEPAWAPRLKDVPLWAIHGGRDRAVLPHQSRRMISAVREAGGDPGYTEAPDVGHSVWKLAFASETMLRWMDSPQTVERNLQTLEEEMERLRTSDALDALGGPFAAALVIPQAVSVRLGNDALETLSYGIPGSVPPEDLTGPLDNLEFSLEALGERFDIMLAELSYRSSLQRVEVRAVGPHRVQLRLGLSIELTIEQTKISSPSRRAQAGPVQVLIGHRRPVWMDMTLLPAVEDHQLRLQPTRTQFSIPDDNWLVKAPERVTAEGPDMTPDLVSLGIVGGLYVRKASIESEVREVIPRVVREIEERLVSRHTDRLARSIWPMPVYEPDLRLELDDIVVDSGGASLVLGIAAAPVARQTAADTPRHVAPVGPRADQIAPARELQVGLAPGILEALSQMLIDANAVRIQVEDMPQQQFAALADPERLRDILSDLDRFGPDVQVRTALSLGEPFRIEPAGTSTAPEASARVSATELGVRFVIPRLVLAVAIKPVGESAVWMPYARFDISVTQEAVARLESQAGIRRVLRLEWRGAAEIGTRGGVIEGGEVREPNVHNDRLTDLFRAAWHDWTKEQSATEMQVPDIGLGGSSVRLEELRWSGPQIVAAFRTPPTRVANRGDTPERYEVRGPFSPWGGPYTLGPGMVHEFEAPYPLTIRRLDGMSFPSASFPVGSLVELPTLKSAGAHDGLPEGPPSTAGTLGGEPSK